MVLGILLLPARSVGADTAFASRDLYHLHRVESSLQLDSILLQPLDLPLHLIDGRAY